MGRFSLQYVVTRPLRGVCPHTIFIARNRPIKFTLIERPRTTKLTHGQTLTDPGKYFDAALDNIKKARKCFDKAGRNADWQAVVAKVRQRHFRKKGFMAGFEDIVAGAPRQIKPPFLEQAKARWLKK